MIKQEVKIIHDKCTNICDAIKDEIEGAKFYEDMLTDASRLEDKAINEIIKDEVAHKNVMKLMSDDNNCKCR